MRSLPAGVSLTCKSVTIVGASSVSARVGFVDSHLAHPRHRRECDLLAGDGHAVPCRAACGEATRRVDERGHAPLGICDGLNLAVIGRIIRITVVFRMRIRTSLGSYDVFDVVRKPRLPISVLQNFIHRVAFI